QAKNGLERIDEFISKLRDINAGKTHKIKDSDVDALIEKIKTQFVKEMDDDFNTPKAMAVIFNLIKEANKLIAENKLSKNGAGKILKFFREIDGLFAILPEKEKTIPDAVKKLAKKRESARLAKNWQEADRLRAEIKKTGYQIEDTPQGPKIMKVIK
ncbi:MAG: hypothetical protein Q8L57_03995, partial [bacterium]|nr:hypothetical protein [bacterium]